MTQIKIIFSLIGTYFIYLLGGWDIAIHSFLIAIILDYLTGIAKAYVTGKLNSNKGLKGIVKKVSMLCLIAIATIVDKISGDSGLIRNVVIYYLVANECLSVIENLGQMDIVVPKILIEKLEQIKGGEDNE